MLDVVRFVNSRFNSNTFILSHPRYNDIWVVDPGDTEPVFEWMLANRKASITGILLTHAHFDHLYGVNEIVAHYPSCKVYIANEYGLDALHDPKVNGSKYTEEGPIVIVDDAKIEFFVDTMPLWDGIDLRTFNTPGHSDDSQCLILQGMLFTGDTLIKDVRTVTKLKGGSVEKLNESMTAIAKLKGGGLMVKPGHGEDFLLDNYDMALSVEKTLTHA